jgi:tetratricopeptide (TPR) repeat protein
MKRLLQSVLACVLLSGGVNAAELESIGTFDFPTSGSPQAHEHFTLGVGYLHSFGWKQAREEFRLAQQLEPDFAMAYWGESFTYNHPFIPEWDAISPGEVLNRLGATSSERLSKAPTEREKGFIRAAEAYAFSPGSVDNKRTAWMRAMSELYEKFPGDREIAAFYAVAMLSGATATGAQRERLNMQAGAIALELYQENADHPGAAHYIIHAFDDPLHAPIALMAASKYAQIAPVVSHARHMPTHIFIQHGMWDLVAYWNESAFNAAAALWQPGDRPNDQSHSADWGQYGDLQLANYERAKLWIARASQVMRENPDDARVVSTVRTMKARYIVESKQWETTALTSDLSADELLAIGLSAAYLDDLQLANQVAGRLDTLARANPNNIALRISQLEVDAMAKLKEGFARTALSGADQGRVLQQQALTLLEQAVELTDQQRLPNGATNPQKPAHELAGEALLEAGRPAPAATLFEQSLLRTPNRPWSLLGLARAQAATNNTVAAGLAYTELLNIWDDDKLTAVKEAKAYLANHR